jgi:hypothetical protein
VKRDRSVPRFGVLILCSGRTHNALTTRTRSHEMLFFWSQGEFMRRGFTTVVEQPASHARTRVREGFQRVHAFETVMRTMSGA